MHNVTFISFTKLSILWRYQIVITKLSPFCCYQFVITKLSLLCRYQIVTFMSLPNCHLTKLSLPKCHYQIVITKLSLPNWHYQKSAHSILSILSIQSLWSLKSLFLRSYDVKSHIGLPSLGLWYYIQVLLKRKKKHLLLWTRILFLYVEAWKITFAIFNQNC